MIRDIAGAGATQGWAGTATSAANIQKQACEDHADAWAVRFTREAGIDPQGGVRLTTGDDLLKQLLKQIRFLESPMAILGERGVVRNLLIETQSGEPTPRQM